MRPGWCWLLALLLLAGCDCGGGDDDDDVSDADDDQSDDDQADDDISDDDQSDDDQTDDDTESPPEITWCDCADFFDDPQTALLIPHDARCGTVDAPWDRAQPDDPTIKVRFAVMPHSGATSHGALAVELGGPDPNLRNLVIFTLQPKGVLAKNLRENFDLLFVEVRGALTSSTPLVCPAGMMGTKYENADEYRALVRQYLADLPTAFSPARMSTVDSVEDLDLVRRALLVEKLRLFGNSYGSRYMLEYMRRHGEHVEAYLFDSTLPPESSLRHDLDRVLRTIADDCAADAACPVSSGEVWSLTAAVLADLDLDPLPTYVSGYTVTEDLFHLGDAPEVLSGWPEVLRRYSEGDRYAVLSWHNVARVNMQPRTSFGTDADSFQFDPYSDNVLGIDHPGWYDTDTNVVLWRLSPPYISFAQQKWMGDLAYEELSALWNAAPLVDRAPVVSALPGLLVAPRFDDATPWTDAQAAIEHGLSGATLVPVNADHTVLLDLGGPYLHWTADDQACLRSLVVDWLVEPFDPYTRPCVRHLAEPLQFAR